MGVFSENFSHHASMHFDVYTQKYKQLPYKRTLDLIIFWGQNLLKCCILLFASALFRCLKASWSVFRNNLPDSESWAWKGLINYKRVYTAFRFFVTLLLLTCKQRSRFHSCNDDIVISDHQLLIYKIYRVLLTGCEKIIAIFWRKKDSNFRYLKKPAKNSNHF